MQKEDEDEMFMVLDMWAHRALNLRKLGIDSGKLAEALDKVELYLHKCKEVIRHGQTT